MATHDPAHHPVTTTHAHDAHAPGAHAHHVVPGADQKPAFMGLIIGGIALFAIMWGVVKLTNAQFEGHGEKGGPGGPGGRPAAEAPKH
jgi:hypothetical protein